MFKKPQPLDSLLKKVSVSLNKSPEDLIPFFDILKSNWYQKEQDLETLTIQDYQRMKIPHRVAQTIKDSLSPSSKSTSISIPPPQPHKKPATLNQITMTAMVDELSVRMQNKFQGNRYQTRSVLEILYKIISNIVKDPNQVKFRTLKKKNNLINVNIVQHEPCFQFMIAVGFEDSVETLELKKFQVPQLIFLQDCLNQQIVRLGGSNQEKQQRPPENMFLDIKKFPTSEAQVKEEFSKEKLSEMKYADALEKLIEVRNRMMAEPPKDRRLRIYHKRFQTKDVYIKQVTFQEEFQKSEDQAIVGYWREIISNNVKGQSFQSKRKLEFQYLIKQKIHKQTLIKIKLPNQIIIEAYFGPLETLQQVFNLAAEIVIGDLYLFTAPPKKIMGKQYGLTLFDLDSVPQGSFYLGQKIDTYYIKKQYVNFIQK